MEGGQASVGRFVSLGLHAGAVGDKALTQRAIAVYAVYRATNSLRNRSRSAGESSADLLHHEERLAALDMLGAPVLDIMYADDVVASASSPQQCAAIFS